MTNELKNNREHHGRTWKGILSLLLALSLVLTPVSVGAAATSYDAQAETATLADASLRDSVKFTVNYDVLTPFEKQLYDMVDQAYQKFDYIDMGYYDFAKQNGINTEANNKDLSSAYQKYIASGQTTKIAWDAEYRALSYVQKNELTSGIVSAYSADHPLDMRVCFTDLGFDFDKNYVYCSIFNPYNYRAFDEMQQKADAAYEQAVAAVRADMRFKEDNKPAIELIVHDYICSRVKYSMPDGDASEYMICHSTYGPLVENRGVCDGISYMTSLLNNTFGVETYILTSDAHAWNLVKLDGEYYELDNTWDLSEDEGIIKLQDVDHSYFNLTSEEIKQEDIDGTETEGAHTREYLGTKLPDTTSTKYNFINVWKLTGMLLASPPEPDDGVYPEKKGYRSDGFVYNLSSDGVAYLVNGKKKKGKVVIPEYVECEGLYYAVSSIWPNAFMNNKKITSVVIPYMAAYVQYDAFNGCSKLKSITLYDPDIQKGAFIGIKKKAVFYVHCKKDDFAGMKAAIKKSGAKKPVIKWVEE